MAGLSSGWPFVPYAQSFGDFLYFKIIHDFLSDEIREFGVEMAGRFMGWAGSVGLVLMTLWLLLQGYRMVTGTLREPMMSVVMGSIRNAIILSTATTMAFVATPLHQFLVDDLGRLIHRLVTGNDTSVVDSIDSALWHMQLAMSSIDALSVVSADAEFSATKMRALVLAGFGSAGPPLTAGALLLVYQVALALFIGLGPLFIVSLMFEQTKGMFQRWLFYGIGTLFSLAVLSFVISLALKLLIAVSAAFWSQKLLSGLTGLNLQEGLSSQAVQQGGIGLLLTLLIVSTPPMVAVFFQGALGHLMHYTAWAGNSALGDAGVPPGSYASANAAAPAMVPGSAGASGNEAPAPNPGASLPPTVAPAPPVSPPATALAAASPPASPASEAPQTPQPRQPAGAASVATVAGADGARGGGVETAAASTFEQSFRRASAGSAASPAGAPS